MHESHRSLSRHAKCNQRRGRRDTEDVSRLKDDLEEGRLGHKAKWEYFRALYERYRKAGREAKRVMLNEFCWNTGYNRKYAIRLVNGPAAGKPAERRAEDDDRAMAGQGSSSW